MQKQDFYGLPRSIQDRFIEASLGASAPLPLGYIPQRQSSGLIWGLGALAIAAGWAAFTLYGLGNLESPFAVSTLPHRLVHIGFAAVATYFAFQAYAKSWAGARMPYRPGTYLFPGVVVEASFGQLVVHEVSAVTGMKAEGSQLVVRLGSSTWRFPQGSADLASIALEKAQIGVERWKASDAGDNLERARLNPLADSGINNPLAPTQAHERPHFLAVSLLCVFSLVIGVGAGYGVAIWRDSLSQKALYKAAITQDNVTSYRAYIARGGNRPEVRRLLLPRAELKLAIVAGTVDAIEVFVQNNPDTEIQGEVHNALRAALLSELEKAKQAGTLKALTELSKRYKDHGLIEAELSAARHEIFVRAFESFKTKAQAVDARLVPFVDECIKFAEAHGPAVHVRVTQDFAQEAELLDQIVIKNHEYYMGVKSQPSQYFLGQNARRREQVLLDRVIAKLQPEFPEEILKFEPQPLPKDANEALAEPTVPTLTFVHKEKLSGGYVGGNPKAMYLGLAMTMTAFAHLPGSAEPAMRYDWSAWRSPDFSILVDSKKDIPDVYEDMVGGAFTLFTDKYLSRWF